MPRSDLREPAQAPSRVSWSLVRMWRPSWTTRRWRLAPRSGPGRFLFTGQKLLILCCFIFSCLNCFPQFTVWPNCRCTDIGKFQFSGDSRRRCAGPEFEGEAPECEGLNQRYEYSKTRAPTVLFRWDNTSELANYDFQVTSPRPSPSPTSKPQSIVLAQVKSQKGKMNLASGLSLKFYGQNDS